MVNLEVVMVKQRHSWRLLGSALVIAAAAVAGDRPESARPSAGGLAAPAAAALALPPPRTDDGMPLAQALRQRRSVRDLAARAVSLADVGQVLWAAQGVTHADGLRTAPSAGATYPLEIYLVAGALDGLAAGVYHYGPDRHGLVAVTTGDVRERLAAAALGQTWLEPAPAIVVVAAVEERTAQRYGGRAGRYVAIEVGAVVQNVQLQAAALGLGSTVVGAFDDAAVHRVVELAEAEQALAIVPVGHPATP